VTDLSKYTDQPDDTRFTFDGDQGTAAFKVDPGETPEAALDRWASVVLGMDAGMLALLDVTEVRAWGRDPVSGRPYQYVKARIRKLDVEERKAAEALTRWMHSRRPRPVKQRPAVDGPTVWWPIADTQLGKGVERLGTTVDTLSRLDWVTYEALPQWTAPYKPSSIVIPLMGDLTEGVCGSYDNQTFTTTLNIADQFHAAYEAVDRLVKVACELSPQIVLTGVASNHDQQSRGTGRQNITDDADDRTLLILRLLADKMAEVRPQVRVVVPDDPNVAVIDDGNLTVAAIHGHRPKVSRTNIPGSIWKWWDSQRANLLPAGQASVLLAAHFHHAYDLLDQGGRSLIGLPSLDNGSQFLTDAEGTWSLPGVRPFATDPDGIVDGTAAMLVWPRDRQLVAETSQAA
jgi:hypothetical protein